MPHTTKSRPTDKVLAALSPVDWRSPREVANATGMGYSTVTKHLRTLVADGRAVTQQRERTQAVYRPATPADDVPGAPQADDVPPAPDGGTGGGALLTGASTPAIPALPEVVKRLWPDETVWMATLRRGLDFHAVSDLPTAPTLCDRATGSATSWFGSIEAALSAGGKPCTRCTSVLEDAADAAAFEAAQDDAVEAGPADPHTGADSPASGDVAAVADWMQQVRPVSAPPATDAAPGPRRRTSEEARAFEAAVKAKTWARGELRDAVAAYLRELPDGADASPGDISTALVAEMAPIATNLTRMVAAGVVVQTSAEPRRYRAVRPEPTA